MEPKLKEYGIEFERDGYGFKFFFDADVDKIRDIEGTDVYEFDQNGEPHLIAEVEGTLPEEIKDMTDDEFNNFFIENGI